MDSKWPDQLKLCLKTAHDASKPWDEDVHDTIFAHRQKKFELLEDEFEGSKELVLSGSALAGKIARVCADHESRKNVSINDVVAGIAAAAYVCKARLTVRGGPENFFLWCE